MSMTPFKKAIAGGVTATILATSVVALSSTTASAQWRGRGGWGGPGIAAGVIGGLAVGALAAGAYNRPYYAPAPAYGYYPYGAAYRSPYPYGGGCYYQPQRAWNGYR